MKHGLLFFLLISFMSFGQDQLTIDAEGSILGGPITERMSYFEDESAALSSKEFLDKKSTLKQVKMSTRVVNLDFTNSAYFVHFSIENKKGLNRSLVLETARPFTNEVELYCVTTQTTELSGDAIPFSSKSIPTNVSALPLSIPAGETYEYVLRVSSKGENLGFSMTFYDKDAFISVDSNQKLFIGVFLGIFIFVIIIYIAFYMMLRERLFLVYVLYAFFSGLMQFAIDGHMHEFVFTSGGYFTQHCVIVIAGAAVIMGMQYATRYLDLKGFWKRVGQVISAMVLVTMIVSLIPQVRFEIPYRLVNSFSMLGLVFMIVTGLIQRRKRRVNNLFLLGLSFLVLGGFVFILGNLGIVDAPFITQNALKLGTLLEMISLAILMAGRYKRLQEEREMAQKALLVELEEKNKITKEAKERLEIEVKERTKEIEAQRLELKEKNEDFMASVTYAERIQSAVLSNEEKFQNILPNSFVLMQPKDVVSGDFYWVDELKSDDESQSDKIGYVTADCTGHGVPGALVSIIGNHLLEAAKVSSSLLNPGKALDELSLGMNAALNSRYVSEQIRDGMDLTLCLIDKTQRVLHFSGARNSAYIVRNGELIELKGDRKSIGFNPLEESHEFETQTFQLEKGDMIYTCSDGYADQFGGPKGKKFMSKRLKTLFIEISNLPFSEQQSILRQTLTDWRGSLEQLDDILVIGVRITD